MQTYADYSFYTHVYGGNLIAEADFPRLSLRASAFIDQITFGRAAEATAPSVVERIQMATCAAAEEIQRQNAAGGEMDGVTSESIGNYSVSFGENSSRVLSGHTKLERAAGYWLANTGLMYRGFE